MCTPSSKPSGVWFRLMASSMSLVSALSMVKMGRARRSIRPWVSASVTAAPSSFLASSRTGSGKRTWTSRAYSRALAQRLASSLEPNRMTTATRWSSWRIPRARISTATLSPSLAPPSLSRMICIEMAGQSSGTNTSLPPMRRVVPTRLFFCSSTARISPSSLPSTRGWASFSTRTRSPGIAPFISRPGMKISPEPSSSMANPKFLPSLTRVQGRALSLRPDRTVKKTPSVWQTTASRTSSSSASITLRSAARSPPNLAFRSLTVQGCIWMARSILSLIGIQVNSPSHPSAHRLLLRAGATSQPGASLYGPDTKTAPRCCGAFSACRRLHAPGGHSPCLAFSCGYGSILLRLAGFSGAPRRALVKTGARRLSRLPVSSAGRGRRLSLTGWTARRRRSPPQRRSRRQCG